MTHDENEVVTGSPGEALRDSMCGVTKAEERT